MFALVDLVVNLFNPKLCEVGRNVVSVAETQNVRNGERIGENRSLDRLRLPVRGDYFPACVSQAGVLVPFSIENNYFGFLSPDAYSSNYI